MYKSLFYLVLIVGSSYLSATVFVPVSIKNQVRQSDGIVMGEVISVSSASEDGVISSHVTVLANKWIGLSPEDNLVKLYFPGGQVDGMISKVHGSPSFDIGENVVLFTKSYKGKPWINNLGLGKYSAKAIGDRVVIVNQIFPAHPSVGQMNIDKFFELAQWVKKEKFKERFKDKYEINFERKKRNRIKLRTNKRSIAGFEVISNESSAESVIWLVLLFGAMGFIFGIVRKKHE